MRLRRKRQRGFTLLEIMIAITIMTVAFGAILTSQSGSIILATKSKELNTAGWLAHDLMAQSEHLLEGKPFSEIKELENGQFEGAFARYSWKREVKELKFPDLAQPEQEGQGVSEIARMLAQTITKFLNESMRELVVTVSWKQGSDERRVVLSTYLIDLNAEYTPGI